MPKTSSGWGQVGAVVAQYADLAGLAAVSAGRLSIEVVEEEEDQSAGLGLFEYRARFAGSVVVLPAAGRHTVVTIPR